MANTNPTLYHTSSVKQTYTAASGTSYTTDNQGVTHSVNDADVLDLLAHGWSRVHPKDATRPVSQYGNG